MFYYYYFENNCLCGRKFVLVFFSFYFNVCWNDSGCENICSYHYCLFIYFYHQQTKQNKKKSNENQLIFADSFGMKTFNIPCGF